MKKLLTAIIFLVLLAVSFWAGSWYKQGGTVKIDSPVVKSSVVTPDKAPDTGAGIFTSLPGMVQISAAKQQIIGVRTDEVRRASASHLLRVPGRITVDDQRLYRIIAAADGWILELGQNTVGRFVKKDQLLASYYTRDLLSTERLFLLSLGASDPSQKGDVSSASIRTSGSATPQFPVDSLRGLGMSDLQIEEIRRTRTSTPYVNIYSPVAGFVLARNISPGQRFDKSTEFYRIADIGHVWVMTDIFEKDRGFVRPGATATVRYQGRKFQARLSDALPQLDPQTRTLKTRFELENPGNILLPDMFVDVEISVTLPPAITVPADAVLDSGLKKTVFVDRGEGFFEPREVETGWRMGNQIEITRGLKPGERIVVSGTFLIDSESRMEMAAAGMYGTMSKDPVCGGDVSINKAEKAGRKSIYQEKTYYFSSDECKQQFDKNPDRYMKKQ